MKKKVLLLLLILFPLYVNAEDCDRTVFLEYQKAASNIEYETSYSVKSGTFSIKFYNVINNMYLSRESNTYSPNGTTEVVVDGIEQGVNAKFDVSTTATTCNSSLTSIIVTLPYYNKYYGSSECKDYSNKISICSSKFVNYEPTEELLESMINNYNNGIVPEEPEVPSRTKTILNDILDFTYNWGIEVLLVVVSSVSTIIIFNARLRKVKHGI